MVPKNIHSKFSLTFEIFRKWVSENVPGLWNGVRGFDFADRDRKPSGQAILRHALLEKSRSASHEYLLAEWWDRLITAGNHSGRWTIPLLPPIIKIKKSKPVFVRRDFHLLAQYRQVEAEFWKLSTQHVEVEGLPDLVFLSAILNSGLTNPEELRALQLLQPGSITGFSCYLLVPLQVEIEKGFVVERLWYPDALTTTFLVRLLRSPHLPDQHILDNTRTSKILVTVDRKLQRLHLPPCGDNKEDFLRAARVAHMLRVTPMSAAYLAGASRSHSLPRSVLFNLCGWAFGGTAQSPEQSKNKPALANPVNQLIDVTISYDETRRTADQHKFVSKLSRLLDRKYCSQADVNALLGKYDGQLWPVTTFLAVWVKWLMNAEQRGSAIRANSARRYLAAIARHLIEVAEFANPLDLDPEDFEELYELAGKRVTSSGEKSVFWGRVRSFHDFLVICGTSDINLSELDGYVGAEGTRVSANLVTESQFATFKFAMIGADLSNPMILWPLLAGILGYRCGLRRREIQLLWLENIHSGADPHLIVRPSALAALKSKSSDRRIPLGKLLLEDELRLLMDYSERRKHILHNTRPLLFSYEHQPRTPVASNILFDPVTEAFGTLTKDSSIPFRFHHLRHSFANWLLLALLISDQPEFLDAGFPLLNSPLLETTRVLDLRDHFFPRLPGTPSTVSRRYLFLVSALLGHLSPDTTLKHYIHLLDWFSAQEMESALAEKLADAGPGKLGIICGLSPSMPHKPPYNELKTAPVKFLREFVKHNIPHKYAAVQSHKALSLDLQPLLSTLRQKPPSHPLILQVILARLIHGADMEFLCKIHDVLPDALDQAISAYRQIVAKQSGNIGLKSLPPPIPPRNLIDREAFHKILESTYVAFSSDEKHSDLDRVASALLKRPGPATGRLYPGSAIDDVTSVVNGLTLMGIAPELIHLHLPSECSNESSQSNIDTLQLARLRGFGITLSSTRDRRNRHNKLAGTCMIEVSDRRPGNTKLNQTRAEGRIKGMNLAAIWIKFALAFGIDK